jgi:hypothetical protein
MLMTPAFWTRIVILVDARPTPLSMIEHQLAWTRDLPIEVTITRRVALRTTDDPHEKARVASVMAIITPQLHRCQKFHIGVSLSPSLPSFSSSFNGYAPLLEELQLECNFDDGGSYAAAIGSLETQRTAPFQCPALRKLAIDDRNFYNACRQGIQVQFPAVTDLAISRFTGYPNPIPLQHLLSALSVMPNLTRLRLTNLDFDPADNVVLHFLSLISLYSLVCEDVGDMDSLKSLIESIDEIADLTLIRCTVRKAYIGAGTLTLKKIDDDLDDLDNILCFWSGENLYLDSCPGFDDAFLKRMCGANGAIASSMIFLNISNCPNFSVPALKRFVGSRERADYECPALEGMRISGDSPYFSPEDILWFKKHLTDFSVVCG